MISNSRKHHEKMKLSDKFKQPFEESSTREVVKIFNGKKQKNNKSKRKK